MGHKFADILFTEPVRAVQQQQGSRESFSRWEQGPDSNHRIDQDMTAFLAERDSFYMASVSPDGWPYLQHRGGPKGFMRVLDETRIGFVDYSGNRQYISTGNFHHNDRVALFFMDYPNRRRLKVLGRVEMIADDQIEQLAQLEDDNYRANVERGFIIHVEAFDWNCPQHITPRFDQTSVDQLLVPLQQQISELKQQQTINLSEIGNGKLALIISGIRQLSPTVRAYELRHAEGKALPAFSAGAHLQIPFPALDGTTELRSYSISSNPARTDSYEIAVLNTGGEGSSAIHQQFNLGMKLNCEPPQNFFELQSNSSPVVLIAAGIGITPIKSMALQLLAEEREFTLHYAARNTDAMAYGDRLQRQLEQRLKTYYSEHHQRLDLAKLFKHAVKGTHFYLCGPNRLINEAQQLATEYGINSNHLHFERFSPNAGTQNRAFQIQLKQRNKTLTVGENETALDALLKAGVNLNYSCKMGQCRSCATEYLKGEVDHRDEVLTETERKHLMCPCVSRAAGETLIVDL